MQRYALSEGCYCVGGGGEINTYILKLVIMKKIIVIVAYFISTLAVCAQGWPDNYGGVMLQGFYWDSFNDTKWTKYEKQAPELSHYFSLVWLPQSGFCGGNQSMGYDPLYYFNQNSSFGSESELRSLIKAFKANGIGTIADVVVNHRKNMSNWVDFPAETYNGVTYQMVSTDICANDDGGAAKKWADENGYKLSSNNDTGEDWSGMRDLDHTSANVQKCVKAYVKYLVDDLGYVGFRYDMAKGFSAKYFAEYSKHAGVEYSVGEHWDNVANAKRWIDATKIDGVRQSAAFDFQFHYRLYDAVNQKNWGLLNSSAEHLVSSGSEYNRYAVTFVENHDTQYRNANEQGSCAIASDIVACNAYLLAMPGTPCVFLKHWLEYKNEIKKLIEARKLVGITNTSKYFNMSYKKEYTAIVSYGKDGKKLLAVIGSKPSDYTPGSQYVKLVEGDGYIYYVDNTVDISGWDAILKRIASEDVPEPEEPYEDRDVTIYVDTNLPTGWAAGYANFWVWSYTDNSNLCQKKTWPGDKITVTKEQHGKKWYYQTYRVTKKNHPINIVLSTSTGSTQTIDFTNIENDKYLEVSAEKVAGKHMINDVTDKYVSGIEDVINDAPNADEKIFTVHGQYVGRNADQLGSGVYVRGGKKYIVR